MKKKTIAYILIALAAVGLLVYYFFFQPADDSNGEGGGSDAPLSPEEVAQLEVTQSDKFNARQYSRDPEASLTPAQKFECRQLSGAARQACYDKYNNIPESPVSGRISDYLRNNPAPVGANITAKAVLSVF